MNTLRESKPSILAATESEDDRGADVIDVNVVILRSKSSRALHRHLYSAAAAASSAASGAASCSASREDVSALDGGGCFMQVI